MTELLILLEKSKDSALYLDVEYADTKKLEKFKEDKFLIKNNMINLNPFDSILNFNNSKKEHNTLIINFSGLNFPDPVDDEKNINYRYTGIVPCYDTEVIKWLYEDNAKEKNFVGTDRISYIKDVPIFRDKNNSFLKEIQTASFLTMLMPNFKKCNSLSSEYIEKSLDVRIEKIVKLAIFENADTIIVSDYRKLVEMQYYIQFINRTFEKYINLYWNINSKTKISFSFYD